MMNDEFFTILTNKVPPQYFSKNSIKGVKALIFN
jgi:hypothetical protein